MMTLNKQGELFLNSLVEYSFTLQPAEGNKTGVFIMAVTPNSDGETCAIQFYSNLREDHVIPMLQDAIYKMQVREGKMNSVVN